MKVLKAGKLIYEDGGISITDWTFDAEGDLPSPSDVITACLEYIADSRDGEINTHNHTRHINAERLMLDCIEQVKK